MTPTHLPRRAVAGRGWSFLCALLVVWMTAACSTVLVSPFDKGAVDRTAAVARQVLAYYQQLLAAPVDERKALVAGPLKAAEGEIEQSLRLNHLLEQARADNDNSARIARELIDNWEEFKRSHRRNDATALGDVTLATERGILERQFAAAFKAEEAKKLASGTR